MELQSVRGIAALVVLIYHCALYFDYGAAAKDWMTLALNAHAAVVSFFVLSGLVLTLSLIRAPLTAPAIGMFYVRRLFRIYPALWVACVAAILYFAVFGGGAVPAAGTAWAQEGFGLWPVVPAKLALAFAGMKPNLPVPIWTLAIEILGSLALPLMILVARRSIPVFAVLTAALAILSLFTINRLVLTPVYLVAFPLGAAIALAAPAWRRIAAWPGVTTATAAGGFVLMWFARRWTGADFGLHYHQGLAVVLESVGAALLIGAIYVRPVRFRPLAAQWAVRLGDMSYSLYLLHMPVLGILAAFASAAMPGLLLAHPGLATIALVLATLMVTLPLADLSFRHVELPGIRMGQRALRWVGRLRGPDLRTGGTRQGETKLARDSAASFR